MKALLTDATGLDSLVLADQPSPTAGARDVIVSVEAATINPVDLNLVTGLAAGRVSGSAPWTPGWDLAGIVSAVGESVERSLIGRRVIGFSHLFRTGTGTQASEVQLPVENVAVSAGLSPAELTTFGLNGMTAFQAIEAADFPEGAHVIVAGASGSVGGFVSQIARHRGFTVVPLGRSSDLSNLEPLGADGVINCGPMNAEVLRGVKDGGCAISVTKPYETVRGITTLRVGVVPDQACLRSVLRLAESGVLSAQVGRTFPLEKALDAYRHVASGISHGRAVLTF